MLRKFCICLVIGFWGLVFIIMVFQDLDLMLNKMPKSIIIWAFNSSPATGRHLQKRGESRGNWFTYEGFCVWSLNGERELWEASETITLCTQGSPEYLHHISELCDRWRGPISVAIYGSQQQFHLVKKAIFKFRKCNTCVRSLVSWHVFFESEGQCPTKSYYPTFNNKSLNCSDKSYLKNLVRKRTSAYPINVARNLARAQSTSHFMMSIDIELYPSDNVIPRFLRMVQEDSEFRRGEGRRVWVLPVFEVDSAVKAPRNKSDLRMLFYRGEAIPFHRYRCSSCHKIPNLKKWMKVKGDDNALHVVQRLKRDKDHGLRDWEPFYIGTLSEPDYDIRLTWEGKQNKMQVAFEMCVLGYDFLLLDDAFLVHSPGINKYDASKETFRAKYIRQNDQIMKQIKAELRAKFPNATGC